MALTNCTITESSLTKVGGAQIGSDNIQLVITPNSGYVVSAAAFTNNTGTLSGISSISFSNSGTANTIGNTVLVAVDLTDTFVMPSANTTLTIDIDGVDSVDRWCAACSRVPACADHHLCGQGEQDSNLGSRWRQRKSHMHIW